MGKQPLESFWRDHLARFENSGLSRAAHCRQHRLAANSFDYWRRRLAGKHDEGIGAGCGRRTCGRLGCRSRSVRLDCQCRLQPIPAG